jgi:hypothetical protein
MIYYNPNEDIYLCIGEESIIFSPDFDQMRTSYLVKFFDLKTGRIVNEGAIYKEEFDQKRETLQIPSDDILAKLMMLGLQ